LFPRRAINLAGCDADSSLAIGLANNGREIVDGQKAREENCAQSVARGNEEQQAQRRERCQRKKRQDKEGQDKSSQGCRYAEAGAQSCEKICG